MKRFTEHTIVDEMAMRDRLAKVRANGWDSALDELDYGLVSVAVPVFDKDRRITSAINCSTSTTRVSQGELIKTRVPLLQQAAREIQAALQKRPYLAHSLTG
jgi:IclR family pca regulon transcriptional regulator